MIVGIGTDILRIQDIQAEYLNTDDPFLKMTYTQMEQEEASLRHNPMAYFATRFAGKEAVYKALNRESAGFRMNEVEILNRPSGQPYVSLHGGVRQQAEEAGIGEVLISLSYDQYYAIAYAAAQSSGNDAAL